MILFIMSSLYVPKFEYKSIRQINSSSGRCYETPGGERLPSVTTILSAVPDPDKADGLKAWRDFVGDDKANAILKESGNIGTLIHTNLEKHIKGEPRPTGSNLIRKQATELSQVIIDKGLCNVSEVWGSEVSLYYPGLWAGTTDCVGIYKKTEAIIDFKNSRKPKTKQQIKDYYAQLVAYCLAHKCVYGTNIHSAVIMCIVRGDPNPKDYGVYQEFVLEGEEFDHYSMIWAKKVKEYYEKYYIAF